MFLTICSAFFISFSTTWAQNDCIWSWKTSCSASCGAGIQIYSINFDASKNERNCTFNETIKSFPPPQPCIMAPCPTNNVKKPCMLPARVNNPAACLDFMKQAMSDPSMFRFGTRLQKICDPPPAEPRNATCRPSVPRGAARFSYQTLGSHMFQDDSYSINSPYLDHLQYPLTVTYTSPPGTYSGCNASVTSRKNHPSIDVNPNMEPMGVFHFRYLPKISAPSCTTTSLCTLILFDVGHGNIHNIWVNYPKNSDLSDYKKPGHFLLVPNPYAWLVFEQSYEITNFTKKGYYPAFSVNITEFALQYGLTGPVATTWLTAQADLYGMNILDVYGFATNFCPQFLEIQLKLQTTTLLEDLSLVLPNELGAWLAVRYKDEISDVWLNPIQNAAISTKATEAAPEVFMALRMFTTPSDYAKRTYTLILARSDVQNTGLGFLSLSTNGYQYKQRHENGSVFLHWLKIDIPGQDINDGVEVLPYLAPNTYPVRQYYFLLYKQNGQNASVTPTLTTDCAQREEKRCRFPLLKFVKDSQLTLEAISRFRTTSRPKNRSR